MVSALTVKQRSVQIFKPSSTFSYLNYKQRFILASCKHRTRESSSVTGSSLKRQNKENILVFGVFILTLEVTVLKVIRIFLY